MPTGHHAFDSAAGLRTVKARRCAPPALRAAGGLDSSLGAAWMGSYVMARATRMTVDTEALLLTVKEVALVLRTSHKAIYAMIERRQLPGVRRIGRRVLIRRTDLLHWLDHNCASSRKE